MRVILRYLKPYWFTAMLAVLLMAGEVAADLSQPALMSQIVDQGIKNRDLEMVLHKGLVMVALAFLGVLGGVGCAVFSSYSSQAMGCDMRQAAFRRIQSFSFTTLDRFSPASLITRLTSDVTQIQNFVMMMLRMMVRAPLLVVGGTYMIIHIDGKLARILLVVFPLLIGGTALIIGKGFPLFTKVQEKLDGLNRIVRENLAGVRVVKAFVRADYEKARFDRANQDLTEQTVWASTLISLTIPLLFLMMNVTIVALLWFGGIEVQTGHLSLGEIIAAVTYMTQILMSLTMIAFTIMAVSRTKASADRIQEIFQAPVEEYLGEKEPFRGALPGGVGPRRLEKALPPQKENVPAAVSLRFDGVSFRYRKEGGEAVLKNVSFNLDAGKTLGILGSTGAGKSTLLHLIPRFYEIESGQILLDGKDIRSYPLDELRSRCGMVFQQSILFSGTIRDNLRWGKEDATDEEIIEAARIAQAHDFIMSFPAGYDTLLEERGVNLSGGQKQRLALARALVRRPALLLLDDTTSAVDMATEARIQEGLKGLSSTVIIVAQRISSVIGADQIIILEHGSIVGIGTHQELLKENPVYQDMYQSQLGNGEEALYG
ncbi:ABC transporter ATP-binding protein [Treponema sp. J25]|uniref:ABC transporter ATP-binding protein n=1 Tax=Treponema sp. J25 TaxID=2094121 RepID=UPI0010536630|nr:ABC transporter ATP-binding protein [Treponema sp. J25]TCW62406.1 multidrug ABC transporter ATP-binding protein [Treponema sp. J25]